MAINANLAELMKDAQIEATISQFFGEQSKIEDWKKEDDESAKRPADERAKDSGKPEKTPPLGSKEESSGASSAFGSAIGAVVGGFFGGPAGAQAGSAAGGFISEHISRASSVPQGPAATISSGTVDMRGGDDHAAAVADRLHQIAARGIQMRAAPDGRKKVY